MASKTKITFLDIPTKLPGPKAVSPWTMRVKYVLDYKNLEYSTEWVEFCDIETTCRKYGIPPTGLHGDGSPHYTLPAIIDKTRNEPVLMADSLPIIRYLDETYPDPARCLFNTTTIGQGWDRCSVPRHREELIAETGDSISQIEILSYLENVLYPTLRGLFIVDIYRLQTDTGSEAWLNRLQYGYNITIDALSAGTIGSPQREEAWLTAKKAFDTLLQKYFEGSTSIFLGIDKVIFVDFVLLSFLRMIQLASPEEGWERVKAWHNGKWLNYVEAFAKFIDLE